MTAPSVSPADGDDRSARARASLTLAAGTLTSRILGFVRTFLLAVTIGTVNAADAFGVANQLPNTMYQLTAGGVLTAVLVPQIVQATRSADGGSAYINRISTLAIMLFTASAAVLTLCSPLLIALYTHDWPADRVALATAMAYLCMPQVFFYGLYALLGGVLNARSVFGPYTWAPVANNLIAIAGLAAFLLIYGADSTGVVPIEDWAGGRTLLLAGSATIGVAAQALILFVFWRKANIRFRPDFTFRHVGLGATFVAAGWILANVVIEAIVGLVQSNVLTFASADRAAGDVALIGNQGMSYVFLVYVLPHSIIAVSIATVYFTRFSHWWSTGDLASFRADFSRSTRMIGVASVFCTAALIVLSFSIVRMFTTHSFAQVSAMAGILIPMSFGLVAYSFFFLTMRALYAVDDTRSVFVITAISAAVRIPAYFAAGLLNPYWIASGIAVATTTACWIEAIAGFVILRRRIGAPGGFVIVRTHVRLLLAAAGASVAGWAVSFLLGAYRADGFGNATIPGALLTVVLAGSVMAGVYVVFLRGLRVQELDAMVWLIRARLPHRGLG